MDFVIVLVILAAVVLFISTPLRRVRTAEGGGSGLSELLAAREAKYREIRDAEMDHRTGKLSDADYAAIDGTLRGEAIEILRAIDTISER